MLVDFWTYTCINCIRTLPYLKAWDERYRDRGLTVVGVHSPEFSFEKVAKNVGRAIRADDIRYPVVQDNELHTWRAWGTQVWPSEYLIDARGQVRHAAFGEGGQAETERAIRTLLVEAGRRPSAAMAQPRGLVTAASDTTPETHLGTARAARVEPALREGLRTYEGLPAARVAADHVSLDGMWRVGPEAATAVRGASITARVRARVVYLVLSPGSARQRRVRVTLDGRPSRTIRVRSQRVYTLVDLPRLGEHVLRLDLAPGIAAFAFTFG